MRDKNPSIKNSVIKEEIFRDFPSVPRVVVKMVKDFYVVSAFWEQSFWVNN
jgi:hypothetical protein